MSHYPTTRIASRQAWRRLRKHVTDSELRDIAEDVTNILVLDVLGADQLSKDAIAGTIEFALSSFAWENKTQG